jgi:hypothetical protein
MSPNPDVADWRRDKRPITARNRARAESRGDDPRERAGCRHRCDPVEGVLKARALSKRDRRHILNNGLYQFGTIKSLGTGAPKHLVINIKPTVGVDHPDYPFTTSREDLKGKVVEALAKIYRDMAAAAGANRNPRSDSGAQGGHPNRPRCGNRPLYDTTYATPRERSRASRKKPYVHEMADRFGDMMSADRQSDRLATDVPEVRVRRTLDGGRLSGRQHLARGDRREGARPQYRLRRRENEHHPAQSVADVRRGFAARGNTRMPKQLFTDDDYAPVLAEAELRRRSCTRSRISSRAATARSLPEYKTRFDAVAVRVAPVALRRSKTCGGLRLTGWAA